MEILFFILLLGSEYVVDRVEKSLNNISIKEKKDIFFSTAIPPINKIYAQKNQLYLKISQDINNTINNNQIEELKNYYEVTTDRELLMALKPIPKSIAIAQAAMESAWGSSRFFYLGNNMYGMWSISKDEKRIAASKTRGEKTIWLKKYDSLEESVKGYYITLAKGKQYKKLRELNYTTDDVYEIIKGLEKYSERREAYVDEIKSIIRYNKLTKYDAK